MVLATVKELCVVALLVVDSRVLESVARDNYVESVVGTMD